MRCALGVVLDAAVGGHIYRLASREYHPDDVPAVQVELTGVRRIKLPAGFDFEQAGFD